MRISYLLGAVMLLLQGMISCRISWSKYSSRELKWSFAKEIPVNALLAYTLGLYFGYSWYVTVSTILELGLNLLADLIACCNDRIYLTSEEPWENLGEYNSVTKVRRLLKKDVKNANEALECVFLCGAFAELGVAWLAWIEAGKSFLLLWMNVAGVVCYVIATFSKGIGIGNDYEAMDTVSRRQKFVEKIFARVVPEIVLGINDTFLLAVGIVELLGYCMDVVLQKCGCVCCKQHGDEESQTA